MIQGYVIWRQYFLNSYHTADAAVSLHDTLGIGVTGAGLTVGAEPGAMAAAHLVTWEVSFTLSTAEGPLVRTTLSQTPGPAAMRECDNNLTAVPAVLLKCCSSASWQCSLHSQVGPDTHLYRHIPGKNRWEKTHILPTGTVESNRINVLYTM